VPVLNADQNHDTTLEISKEHSGIPPGTALR